jgi:hypothetical protein
MGRVDNGSDVRLLGRVCVERRGAPGSLDGLGCTQATRAGEAGQAGPVLAEFQPTVK